MYNAQNAKETPKIAPDTIFDGAVISIQDGRTKDFVTSDKWKGDLESNAINVTIEVVVQGSSYKINQVFTYLDVAGTTTYSSQSNLGKYKAKYGKLPELGDKVRLISNKEGFLKLKLD